MANFPSRDITGKCEGECRNIVREADEKRQSKLNEVEYSITDSTPSLSYANSRNAAPGFLGGHV
ncbi:MAG: hypothetical protein V6Z89_03360 [Desulfobacter sp.]